MADPEGTMSGSEKTGAGSVERPGARTGASPWRIIVTLALTAGLVALFLSQVSVTTIVSMLKGADPGLTALAAAAYALSYASRAARWQILTPSKRIPAAALIGITAVHNLMLRVLPAKLGETSYFVLMKARGVPGTEAVAGLVMARIYDTAFAILFFVLALFLAHAGFGGSAVANVLVAALLLGLCGFALLRGSLIVRAVNAVAARLARASWFPRFLLGHGVRGRLDRLEVILGEMQSIRNAPILIFHTIVIWTTSFVMTWLLLRAFGEPFGFWGTVFASTTAIVATLLPVGTLGNFGTQEAGWTFGMMLLGVDRETAIATGFSTHLVNVSLAGLFGLVGAWLAGVGVQKRKD